MKKILTIILDGFGYSEETRGNAIVTANPKNFNNLWSKYPHSLLWASEEPVGLLKGQFGNSEVGHMTIGAGRKLKQNIDRIHDFLDNDIDKDEKYLQMVENVKNTSGRVHIMGLFSNGLVHSDMSHFLKLYKKLIGSGINEIYFHLITDGRDTGIKSATGFIEELEESISMNHKGKIASICGRYYAMDRDNKLDRTKIYYDLITKGVGYKAENAHDALTIYYENNITDEFMAPIILDKNGIIMDGDTVIWMNYRTDRAKQIIDCLVNPDYDNFPVKKFSNLSVYSFVPIDKKIPTISFLEDQVVENPLGIYLSKLGLTQARIAETEKYAHVTYFFDGTYNGRIENCSKYLIPSLKIKTYDLDPRMSAVAVTKQVIACMEKDTDFILVNFANPDMVGHTGVYDAAVKAVMTVDVCLGKLLEEAENNFYKVIVTADHGNVDKMIDEADNIVTTHTLAKVPFIIVDKSINLASEGDLTNIAPTILDYMDIAIPKEMKGSQSLIINK
jgi:2,3-bisphosphoglycerate-independent phosphoglycerate mutase